VGELGIQVKTGWRRWLASWLVGTVWGPTFIDGWDVCIEGKLEVNIIKGAIWPSFSFLFIIFFCVNHFLQCWFFSSLFLFFVGE
jgi:hypothetical protein